VAVGVDVVLLVGAEEDGSGNGFGRALPSVHPERPSPTKAATAASVRTVRA
jgi:hypothetical protein